MISRGIKEKLWHVCIKKLEVEQAALQDNLASVEESRNNETKSSVGDKYETGRAMMQLEHQKLTSQLQRLKAQIGELKVINLDFLTNQVRQGSLVQTDGGIYFICTALGKVEIEATVYYCISLQSPIGKLLQRKVVGDQVVFHDRPIQIEAII